MVPLGMAGGDQRMNTECGDNDSTDTPCGELGPTNIQFIYYDQISFDISRQQYQLNPAWVAIRVQLEKILSQGFTK